MKAQKITIDEWLKRAFSEAGDCPPPELFLKEERQILTDEERQLAERHCENCTACAAEQDLAKAFDMPAEWSEEIESELQTVLARIESDEPLSTVSKSGRPDGGRLLSFPSLSKVFSRSALSLTAVAAVAVLAVGLVVQTRSVAPPELPDLPSGDVTRGSRIEILEPSGDLAYAPDQFRWQLMNLATRYEVTLRAVDETILWQGSSSGDRLVFPEEARSTVQSAVVYLWQVEAFDEAGSRIAWSAPMEFMVLAAAIEEAP